MSDKNVITMLSEKFENGGNGEQVDGITIIIDGKIKDIFDTIISKSNDYNSYTEVLRDSIFMGINEIIKTFKK